MMDVLLRVDIYNLGDHIRMDVSVLWMESAHQTIALLINVLLLVVLQVLRAIMQMDVIAQ
jgi:hypothetical protein